MVVRKDGVSYGIEMGAGAIRSGGRVTEVDIAVTGVSGWEGGTTVGNEGVERVVGFLGVNVA